MKKFTVPLILFVLAVGVVSYLFFDFSGNESSFNADVYLKSRARVDSLEIALWEAADKPDVQLAIRSELDSSWESLNALRKNPAGKKVVAENKDSVEIAKWVIGGAVAVVFCVILLLALGHHKKVLTRRMEAVKAEQRFREPKNGFENDPTLVPPRPRPVKRSIIDDVVGEVNNENEKSVSQSDVEPKVAFEDENGVPENKILCADPDQPLALRPTAKERITSAMQSLSDVLRSPRGVERSRTMKIRAQSHNTTGDPNLQKEHKDRVLETNRFDREFTVKSKIMQMSRRGFPASAIAMQLKIPQEQVEAVIKEALNLGM